MIKQKKTFEVAISEKAGKVDATQMMPDEAVAVYLFAHGAGAGKDHQFMSMISEGLYERNIGTLRFNFPYIQKRRKSPGSPKEAMATIGEVFNHAAGLDLPIFAGGKSYGGRMTSHEAVEGLSGCKGLIYFGFPLHAPGRATIERAAHLKDIRMPQLFLQGERDKLADIRLIRDVVNKLPEATIHEIAWADHSFKVPKKADLTQDKVYQSLLDTSANWIKEQIRN